MAKEKRKRTPKPTSANCLVFINGQNPGKAVELDRDAIGLTMGRDDARDIPLDDPVASRLHARLWFDGQRWQIEDCGSSNGTKVNSDWVERKILEPGDLIRVGDSLMVFLAQNSSLPTPKLRPSVLAGTTAAIKISTTDRDSYLLNPSSDSTTEWPAHLLPLVYRLSTMLTRQPNVPRVAKVVVEAIAAAIRAGHIVIWLTGRSGRLRRIARLKPKGRRNDMDHLLASLVMERDEAIMLTDPEKGGPALATPVPGRTRPIGAIECHSPTTDRPFVRADLEFLTAVAHQLGMAADVLHHRQQLEQANEHLRRRLHGAQRLVGDSPAVNHLIDQIHRVAPTESNVLVLGESGTGKELVANSIHELSARSAGPFIAVNCAAFNESLLESELFGHESGAFTGASSRRLGQFERAHLGTMFLDEIGEMSPNCQAKLLRILEGHPFERLGGSDPIQVNVRIIAATHRDLSEMTRQANFREDLYYRLRVIELRLPPLRDRGEDILQLAVRFLDEYRRQIGRGPTRFSRESADEIVRYKWPGNVRELKNAVERAVVLGVKDEVTVADLALSTDRNDVSARMISLSEAEHRHILDVLD